MKAIIFYLSLFVFTFSYSQNLNCTSGDCYDGYGTRINSKGDKYTGEFKKGNCDGLGTYFSKTPSGKTFMYQGKFKDNLFHGLGSVIIYEEFQGHPMPTIEYSGHWKNNKKHGMIRVDDFLREVERWCVFMNDELQEVLFEFDRSGKK